ncbi:MAG: trypsin-like peptidase domain-containing protein [Candidatus Hermodarchaeota archaeon]|nr:trypsin-like peptidase domain-containing protein [Candidatus Hermodarchaeota archaeon]
MPIPTHPFQEELIQAVKRVTPSVVSVSTLALMRNFYRVHPVGGMGSGVVLDNHNHIVTNRHVVAKAQRISVADTEGGRHDATLLGGDQLIDIAVLKVEEGNLIPAKLGDSDELEVGQLTIAVGNPYGFILGGPTVTTGVISAVQRQIQARNIVLEKLIQTDAAINPGNSGGPLCDIDGNVIGINTAMLPWAQGIGFAIPINTVKEVAEEIIEFGRVRRAYMGFMGVGLNPQIARTYKLPVKEGVLIAQVVDGSPAARAGLQEGDVIVAFDGEAIRSMGEIQEQLRKRTAGSLLEVTVARGQRRRGMSLILGEVPA